MCVVLERSISDLTAKHDHDHSVRNNNNNNNKPTTTKQNVPDDTHSVNSEHPGFYVLNFYSAVLGIFIIAMSFLLNHYFQTKHACDLQSLNCHMRVWVWLWVWS